MATLVWWIEVILDLVELCRRIKLWLDMGPAIEDFP